MLDGLTPLSIRSVQPRNRTYRRVPAVGKFVPGYEASGTRRTCSSSWSAGVTKPAPYSSPRTAALPNGVPCSPTRTLQNAPVIDRVVSYVTITDPRHSLFGQRLVVLAERSGRGPGYV